MKLLNADAQLDCLAWWLFVGYVSHLQALTWPIIAIEVAREVDDDGGHELLQNAVAALNFDVKDRGSCGDDRLRSSASHEGVRLLVGWFVEAGTDSSLDRLMHSWLNSSSSSVQLLLYCVLLLMCRFTV